MLVQACGSGIEDENMNQVSIYPNPTTDVVTISINDQMVQHTTIEIVNLVGSVVHQMVAIQPKTMISADALGLRSGIYLIKINYENQHKVVRLIVR
jgi:S-ribosylhomocysteine lyase LuxS involved in autoinducer biosynthesis